MATSQPSSAGPSAPAQEYKVRVSKPAANKRFSIMKFNTSLKLDLAKVGPVSMERENNLKQYKNAYDVDVMPKFGAGSEFGREQKDEARRKKYGIMTRKYNPNDQPWLMKTGTKDKTTNFKGTREGTVSDNTSYYIFTQCADGAFDAYPIEDWYAFNPIINYKYLNSEEAEEVYEKRDKTFNYFSVMLRKRLNLKNEDDEAADADEGETSAGRSKSKSKKDLILTELEDWSDSDADNDDDDEDNSENEAEKKSKKEAKADAKNKKKKNSFRRKNSKQNRDDEAIEESDEGDYDDKEVDYITDPSSESETETKVNYDDGGVEDEDGLRKINESGGESDEEDEEKKDENSEEKKDEKAKPSDDSESSGPSSDSEGSDDPEADTEFSSALFMSNKKDKKSNSNSNSATNSRSSTPINADSIDRTAKKRKAGADFESLTPAKRPGPSEAPIATGQDTIPIHHSSSAPSLSSMVNNSEGISEENIRRYLMRKPMTTKELLQKFRFKKSNLTNEQLATALGQMLKRINPDKNMVKGKMYLSIKK